MAGDTELIELLEGDFDQNAIVSKAFEKANSSDVFAVVSDRLSDLDTAISKHVSEHGTELLNQTVDLENFTNIIDGVESRIRSVYNDVERIKQRLTKPYDLLRSHVTRIRRLGLILDSLRKIQRISTYVRRLQQSSNDLSKASEALSELKYAFTSMDWQGIDVLEKYHVVMIKERSRIEAHAWQLIRSSSDVGDQARLGLGLQVFDRLSLLPTALEVLISERQAEIERAVQAAVDVEELTKRTKNKTASLSATTCNPGRASYPINSNAHNAAFRSLFWTGLDQLLATQEQCVGAVRLLAVTLCMKRISGGESAGALLDRLDSFAYREPPKLTDLLAVYAIQNWTNPETQACCAAIVLTLTSANPWTVEAVPDIASICALEDTDLASNARSFCDALSSSSGLLGWASACMETHFQSATKRSSHLKEAFEGEYPRLLKLFLDFWRKVATTPQGDCEGLQLPSYLLRLLQPYETAYLTRSLSRLFERVGTVVAPGATVVPEPAAMDCIIEVAATELSRAAVQTDLLCKVANNIAKMVALFATKAEGLIEVGPMASQISGPPSPAQESNFQLVNLICHFGRSLRHSVARHVRGLPAATKGSVLSPGLSGPEAVVDAAIVDKLNPLCRTILEPLAASLGDGMEEILVGMHQEFSSTPPGSDGGCSAYIQSLQGFLRRLRTDLFSRLSTPTVMSDLCHLPRRPSDGQQFYTFGEIALLDSLREHLSSCIDTFLLHASLLRPDNGRTASVPTDQAAAAEEEETLNRERIRHRLATDCVEFELTLEEQVTVNGRIPGCRLIDLAPEAYARLRAFRPLLLIPTEDLLTTFTSTPAEGTGASPVTTLSGTLVLHHAISRAPAEIPCPHTASGWSLARYVHWVLHTPDEAARLNFISHALAVYTEQVKARNQREYPAIFPIIRNLLEHFVAKLPAQNLPP
uniref:Conserved oligomeric Golgi complex subunit 5 n=2 Tax=Schistocephalus solidus TaxID=70667 RepID=A0A0X3PSK0_SCHSO